MSFLIITNVFSSFGLSWNDCADINISCKYWYDNPSLHYWSSPSIREAVDTHDKISGSYAPSLISGMKNVWYHCEDMEYYEVHFIQSMKDTKHPPLDTHILFFNGGTYLQQLPRSESIYDYIKSNDFMNYLMNIGLNFNSVKSLFKDEHSASKEKVGNFLIEYMYAVDSKTLCQLLHGPAYLKISMD